MAAGDAITFRQTNFSSAFACFENMRKTGDLCDLIIQVSSVSLSAHRVVLAARIPYFRSVFSDLRAREADISLSDFDSTILESLINYAYTGTINISFENVSSLLPASQIFHLEEVSDACVEFLSGRLILSNVLEVLNLANRLNKLNLTGNCIRFIQENFEEFSRSDDFANLTDSVIKEIISVDDLNVTNEKIVVEAVLKWVKYSPSERHVILPELLKEVRMIFLPFDYLIQRVSSEELIKESLACRNLVEEQKNYRLNKNNGNSLKIQPRKYKSQPGMYAVCKVGFNEFRIFQYGFVDDSWRRITSWTYSHTKNKDNISSVVVVNAKLYMFFREIIQTFCPQTLEWQQLEARHSGIKGATVIAYEEVIYCFGSYDVDLDCALRRFDTQQEKWLITERMKNGKCTSAGTTLGGFIYITGGYNQGKYLSRVENYNPLTKEWKEVASLLTPRRRHGCVSINEKIYVFGGSSDDRELQTGEMYDPLINKWNFVTSMRFERCGLSLVCHNNEIYRCGGLIKYAAHALEVEIYDPETDEWRAAENVPRMPEHVVAMPGDY